MSPDPQTLGQEPKGFGDDIGPMLTFSKNYAWITAP